MITKEKFIEVYKKHKPSIFIKSVFWFNKPKDSGKYPNKITILLLSLFLIGALGIILKLSHAYILIPTAIFSGLIFLIVGATFLATYLNNRRIKRIMKELKINSTIEFNELEDLYL